MPLTLNADTYSNDVPRSADSMRYQGPNHTMSANDYVDVSRTAAKPTATYDGKGRARFKLTRDVNNGFASVGDAIVDINVSFPVGSVPAQQAACITDVATWLATASADDLFSSHDIVQ